MRSVYVEFQSGHVGPSIVYINRLPITRVLPVESFCLRRTEQCVRTRPKLCVLGEIRDNRGALVRRFIRNNKLQLRHGKCSWSRRPTEK